MDAQRAEVSLRLHALYGVGAIPTRADIDHACVVGRRGPRTLRGPPRLGPDSGERAGEGDRKLAELC